MKKELVLKLDFYKRNWTIVNSISHLEIRLEQTLLIILTLNSH